MNTLLARRISTLIAAWCLAMLVAIPAQAAPPVGSEQPTADQCRSHKQITDWHSRRAIEMRGFNFDIVGDQASVDFGRTMSLNLASNPLSSTYTASRVTEIDSDLPIAQRVKCWQATPRRDVVVEFRVRFEQSATPPNLIENLFLWNAPLPVKTHPEPPVPATAIGVSRNSIGGPPAYRAVIAQDVPMGPSTQPFIVVTPEMPAWLDAGEWHRVRITLSQKTAQVEVAQGDHGFTVVAQATLLHPAEPLGFEFSVDNEVCPGVIAPVVVPDSLEVSYLKIGLVPTDHK